jgi:hypothetical protein
MGTDDHRPRWTTPRAEGKRVVLVGPQTTGWTVFEFKTAAQASRVVRELQAWSRGDRDLSEFKNLCQAGDLPARAL